MKQYQYEIKNGEVTGVELVEPNIAPLHMSNLRKCDCYYCWDMGVVKDDDYKMPIPSTFASHPRKCTLCNSFNLCYDAHFAPIFATKELMQTIKQLLEAAPQYSKIAIYYGIKLER